MKRPHLSRTAIAILCSLASLAASAVTPNPTPQRAYVSLSGSDANNCGPTSPCRTFAMALTQVNPDGEVLVLDSGAYGTMTITQGVSIIAPPGVYAGISVFSGDGVTINAPGAKVVLKGLTINGLGGSNGIQVSAANLLRIENCTVTNFTSGAAIGIVAPVNASITDTMVSSSAYGVWIDGGATAVIHRSRAIGNSEGFYAHWGTGGPLLMVISDSIAEYNSGWAIYGYGGPTTATIEATGVEANKNGTAFMCTSSTTCKVSNSTVIGNTVGFNSYANSVFTSGGNNKLSGNTTQTVGTITVLPTMTAY
jgi:nitrous oxidase accessory protein NosD